ncbi:PAS domain S-box protein [Natronogracilivirga saccharolytica]|uniref:PAS domain S-box protein n=1 Tax=Natronogracilivirga saccharolytica TaxID=2812953 RepID=A0A8J7RTP4_9BACT|nr:PAS domain S-box protein [Natronogracilivirga saccharolytica]MBP3192792.1 PAS domain S-box protein [Natronogracilivirga saccharolytica]
MDILEVIKIIRAHAKDEKSVEALKDLFEEIIEERDQAKKELSLLEAAIRNDYESIVITELDLESPGPRIVYVNQGFEKMTGYKKEEVIGQTPRILQGPKTDRETLDRLKDNLIEGKAFFGQTVNYRKDGSEFINQWDIHPLVDEGGKITHWVSYQHDITERKRVEQTLVDSKVEMDDFYETSKRTILDIAGDGTIRFANKSLQELIGYEKEELQKMKVWEIMPEKHGAILKERFQELWDANFETQSDYRFIFEHKSGLPIQVEATIKPLELKTEKVMRMEVSNISLRKKVLKTLYQRNQDFSRIFNTKSDFKYGLSFSEAGAPEFRWLSEDLENITGYDPSECEGHEGWKKLVHPDDQAKAVEHLKKVIDGRSMCTEYRLVSKNGAEIPVMDYAKPVEINTFDIKGAVALVKKGQEESAGNGRS